MAASHIGHQCREHVSGEVGLHDRGRGAPAVSQIRNYFLGLVHGSMHACEKKERKKLEC
jgi:hypothetical protein